ncbi:uncharacterized protein LOC116918552 [Daphnia magna]|uniref:uncharacterized protein LOC116918552 n=1 Tax=Daphnia magna TaxID=35525 RepID=UPI001E1BDAC9|nr:uncharacterized protein LOC116918552 [Daphnia magna]
MERKWLRSKNFPKLKDYQETMLKSIQYQMLDSIQPMLHAWNQLRTDDPLFSSLESSLRLLGFAFANVSKLRRENVIRHVATSMNPLLKDPRAFSSREFERLFGSKFIDVMVKEVDDDAKLAKIGRDGGSSSSQSRGNFNRRNGDRNQNSHDGRNNQIGGFSNRGKGEKNDKGSPFLKQPLQGAINKYVDSFPFLSSSDFPVGPPVRSNNVGSRLSNFANKWHFFSNDQWILSTVVHGYSIDFIVQYSTPSGCIMSEDIKTICVQEVNTLLEKAPRVFTKLLKPVVVFLRGRGIRLIIYLDDLLILNQSHDDSSLHGWGAICDGSRSRGPWTAADKHRHINELELLAAYFSLQAREIEDGARLQRLDASARQVQTAVANLAGTNRPFCVGLERQAPQIRELENYDF